jgi:electron transport complex protein RnfG
MTNTKKNVLYFSRIISVLLVITMCIAGLLAFVNEITKDKIAENEQIALNKALSNIFEGYTSLDTEDTALSLEDNAFNGFYTVKSGEELIGYYAKVSPKGFKGAIVMLVGIKTNGEVCGIEIVSSGETPGIGDKIEKDGYLDKVADGQYDTISGATYSSKAVINGTKLALDAYTEYKKGVN